MLINGEYIVNVPKESTQDQLDAIYQLIMTYTFPLNMNPLNKQHIKQLPEKERKLIKIASQTSLANTIILRFSIAFIRDEGGRNAYQNIDSILGTSKTYQLLKHTAPSWFDFFKLTSSTEQSQPEHKSVRKP